VVITLQSPAHAADVRTLMRRAGVVPLAANVSPGSALLRSIAGPPATRVAPAAQHAVSDATVAASPGTGRGAVAMSAGYRGRRR
jgi:methylglyoxal synthase